MSKESKINKESRTVLLKGKKGQLTIFIALGIIILFIFIFLIQFNQKLVKAKLETSQEDVLSKTFKKEALRIFVEDCLRDELRSAILLIGKQGRVWNAQPGGKEAFAEGVNGIYISEEDLEISYALTRKNYLSSVNAYPCLDESNPSFFCKYAYPGINVKFGEVQRWEFFWEKEIESYLKATAQKCIDDYLKEHAKGAIFQPKDFNLDVDLQEGGVLVDAFYPLGFKLGNEDFFHLSVFDFFYPTKLKKMLRASFFYPLEMDWRYVDFNYSSETLQQNSFQVVGIDGSALILPTYSQDVHNLEITTDRKRMANGDTIFTFKSPFPHILDTPEEFILNIARQNRAPALDYIHRGECTEAAQSYDYLVVRGDEQYGDIDILLQARDPDEDIADDDQIKYWIESTDSFINSHIYDSPNPSGTSPSATSTQPGPTGSGILGNYLYADQEEILTALPLGNYELTAFAKDKYGQQDYQTVKIAVDRSIESDAEVDVQISLPYKVRSGTGLVDYASVGDAYYISPEDPVVVGVKMPEFSTLSEVELSKVTYVSGTNSFEIDVPGDSDSCIDFPSGTGCDSASYNSQYTASVTKDWITGLPSPNLFNFPSTFIQKENYDKLTSASTDGSPRALKVDFSATYCGRETTVESSREVQLQIKSCIPHRSTEYPDPFIPETDFYQNKYRAEGTGFSFLSKDNLVSPLLANHTCCDDDYKFKAEGTECFRSSEPICSGKSDRFLSVADVNYKNKIAEQLIATCNGQRGNVCGADVEHKNYQLTELRCGVNDKGGCANIAAQCQGNLSWGYADTNKDGIKDGWCNGKMGCSDFCPSPPVISTTGTASNFDVVYNTRSMNQFAFETPAIIDNKGPFGLGVVCGCGTGTDLEGKPCDLNRDGQFEGHCNAGNCISNS